MMKGAAIVQESSLSSSKQEATATTTTTTKEVPATTTTLQSRLDTKTIDSDQTVNHSPTSVINHESTSDDILDSCIGTRRYLGDTMDKIANECNDQDIITTSPGSSSNKDALDPTANNIERRLYPLREIRNQMFQLISCVGIIATKFLKNDTSDTLNESNDDDSHVVTISTNNVEDDNNNIDEIGVALCELLHHLLHLSQLLNISLYGAVIEKINLNQRKYPTNLCKGKAGKYTEYTTVTGISKTIGQETVSTTTVSSLENSDQPLHFQHHVEGTNTNSSAVVVFINMIPLLNEKLRQFAIDREWQQYHTPRNILLALTGELGELMELLQWKGDSVSCTVSIKEIDSLGQELADVTIYLIRLADVCNINLYKLML